MYCQCETMSIKFNNFRARPLFSRVHSFRTVQVWWSTNTPFTKASPNYPHKNYADNSIKLALTISEHPKIIHFFYERPLKKILEKTDEREGKRWPLTAPWKLSASFWNCIHKFRIWSRCGHYADNCSIKKVRIILVPFRFYDQIMRILSALLNLWMGYQGIKNCPRPNINFWEGHWANQRGIRGHGLGGLQLI